VTGDKEVTNTGNTQPPSGRYSLSYIGGDGTERDPSYIQNK